MSKYIKTKHFKCIGMQYGNPLFKRGDLVKPRYSHETKSHGIGIVIDKKKLRGFDKYQYQVYWQKMKRVTTYNEPYLRLVEGAKENGK